VALVHSERGCFNSTEQILKTGGTETLPKLIIKAGIGLGAFTVAVIDRKRKLGAA
jgi:hypothetical protein